MKTVLIFLFFLMISTGVFAQANTPVCYCPTKSGKDIPALYKPKTKATRVFDLGNGKSIALCGYEEKELIKEKTLYSEFVLSTCGSDKVISFWGAVETCDVLTVEDTLCIKVLKLFPAKPTVKETFFPWTIERLFFTSDKLNRTFTINHDLPKYSAEQIASVLSSFEHTPNRNNETLSGLADKLLICAMSGSKRAENDLINFKKKFSQIDGAIAEEYDDTFRMLKLWQKQGFKTVTVKN